MKRPAGVSRGIPALVALTTIAILLAVAFAAQNFIWREAENRTAEAATRALNRTAFIYENRLRARASDLFILKSIAEAELKTRGENEHQSFRDAATALMFARPLYDKLRLFDLNGKEVFRLNWTPDTDNSSGIVREVPDSELQVKFNRPFFQQILSAPAGTAVFSEFDLNVEHDAIELPHKSVLRISTKLRGPDGQVHSILTLTALGKFLLMEDSPAVYGKTYIASADGHWLTAPHPKCSWAFSAGRNPSESFPALNAALQEKLTGNGGWFIEHGQLFAYRKIDPSVSAAEKSPIRMPIIGATNIQWTLVGIISEKTIYGGTAPAQRGLWMVAGLAALVLGPFSWIAVTGLTRRKAEDDRLRQSERLLSMAGRMSKVGAWSIVFPSREIEWSEEIYRIFDVPADYQPVYGGTLANFPEPGRSALVKARDRCMTDGTPFDLTVEFINAKDQRLWVRSIGEAEFENGSLRRMFGTFQDVTEARNAAAAIEEAQGHLHLVLRDASMGLWSVNLATRKITMDEHWLDLLGLTAEEAGNTTTEFVKRIHPDDLPVLLQAEEDVIAGKTSIMENEHRFLRPDGQWRYMLLRGRIVDKDAGGKPLRLAGTVMDITERRMAAEKVRMANAELQEAAQSARQLAQRARFAERAKSDFLAMMSHEIRTPMNGILGFAEVLSTTPLQPDQKEHLHTITSSGEALLRIIDDILDFSRIEAGKLEVENTSYSPAALLADIRTLLGLKAERKGIALETNIDPNVPAMVIGDPGRLRQVLINLAGNAIKFTSQGSVTLGVEVIPSISPQPRLQFSVTDTGAGIPTNKILQIFEPFAQEDSSIARRYGGTGLGLAISQRLVDLMGGHLGAKSEPGKGSKFFFSLPLVLAPSQHPPTTENTISLNADFARSHPLRILIVEDDATNLRLTQLMLRRLGYQPLSTSSGWKALEIVAQTPPHCILMDLQMPEMDGMEVTRRIRELSHGKGIYIVALTANVLPGERDRCVEAGMDDYLHKPLRAAHLAAVLARAAKHAEEKFPLGEHAGMA